MHEKPNQVHQKKVCKMNSRLFSERHLSENCSSHNFFCSDDNIQRKTHSKPKTMQTLGRCSIPTCVFQYTDYIKITDSHTSIL